MGIAVLLGVMAGLQSCNKALQNLHFNLGLQTQTVTVTIPPASGNISAPTASASYNVDSFIKAQTGNQLGVSNINSLKLTSCVLVLGNTDSVNSFGNFSSCTASFYSNANSTPYSVNLPSNPAGFNTTLNLPVDSTVELKNYIGSQGTQFYYNLSGALRTPTTRTLTCTITFTYSLVVQG